jgi:hypothetical protein
MGRTLEQLMADEKPEVVADARAMAADILLNIHLAELREKVQKTQVDGAGAGHQATYRCRHGKTRP